MKTTNCKDYILKNIEKVSCRNELFHSHPKESYENFVIEEKYIDSKHNAFINIEEVIGTDHTDYQNKTWKNALKSLKREGVNLSTIKCNYEINTSTDTVKNLNFYNSAASIKNKLGGNDPWSADIYLLDGKTESYITQGNNRTIVSKFLYELKLIEKIIPVTSYVSLKIIDTNAMNLFHNLIKTFQQEISSNYIRIEMKQNEISSNEESVKKYALTVVVTYLTPYQKLLKSEYQVDDAHERINNELKKRMSLVKKVFLYDEV